MSRDEFLEWLYTCPVQYHTCIDSTESIGIIFYTSEEDSDEDL
jgi:hypothetical protein